MKSLLLLRHAKSSWKDVDVTDHERPLNKRGKTDAPRIGKLLKRQELLPDRIISSSAKRARKTAARVAKASGYHGVIELSGNLYMADPAGYVEFLQLLSDDASRVMVVGHNPGLEDLLAALTGQDEPLPTAALAHLALPIDNWSDLQLNTHAELIDLWRPKELAAK